LEATDGDKSEKLAGVVVVDISQGGRERDGESLSET